MTRTLTKPESNTLVNTLWDDQRNALALGCTICPTISDCGGLRAEGSMFDCRDFCCGARENCQFVCPRRPREYVARRREVQGWSLETVPMAPDLQMPSLPTYVPWIKSGSRRAVALQANAVAIPLRAMFKASTGEARFRSRQEMFDYFRIGPESKIIVDGVSTDQPLEDFWGRARDRELVNALAKLGVALVTVPNFSLFVDVPKDNDCYNMKRIAIAWYEFQKAGVPAALHLNARTDRDYERWAEFIDKHSELGAISFEFGTGARRPRRRTWHVAHLCKIGRSFGNRLRLFLRGGRGAIRQLGEYFPDITAIDTTAYMKTMKRYRANRRGEWRRSFTLLRNPLDELLQQNIQRYGTTIEKAISRAQAAELPTR